MHTRAENSLWALHLSTRTSLSNVKQACGYLRCRRSTEKTGLARGAHGNVRSGWSFPIQVVLKSKVAVAAGLKNSAQPERPGNVLATQKEVAHLHRVSCKPIADHG